MISLDTTTVARATDFLRSRFPEVPRVAVVLGSGLGAFADGLSDGIVVPYDEIPNFPVPSVSGHSGRLVFGRVDGTPTLAMQGRLHLYEGIPVEAVTFGVRVFAELGVPVLLLTTASGGVNRRFRPGDIMVIDDQINFQMRQPPFHDLHAVRPPGPWRRAGSVYSPRLVDTARRVAVDVGIPVQTGIFAGMLGPTYETPAEVRMTAMFGADAISMSTVLEAITAHRLGMDVAGISAIVNPAAGLSAGPLNHEEVLEGARKMESRLLAYLRTLVPALAAAAHP